MSDYDVVVVGGGGAGLCAALSAADAGARTLVLEVGDKLGGSTALSAGVVYAAGTSVQRARGVTDTADAMYLYYMILNQYRLNGGLVRRICDKSAPTIEWLIDLGVKFPPELLYDAGLDGVLRGHYAEGRGRAVVDVLDRHLSAHSNIDVSLRSRAEGLVLEVDRIAGVRVGDDVVTSQAVVIASGGFGANHDMIERYLPATAAYGDSVWYIGSPNCRGDGLQMGLAVGAEVTGIDSLTPILSPGFTRDFEPLLPGWLVLVDANGNRFTDEYLGYELAGIMVRDLPGGHCFALFDEATRVEATRKPAKKGPDTPTWKAEYLARMAEEGRIWRADSIATLAQRAGIDRARLETTIAQYNRDADAGVDLAYFKDAAMLRPLREPPFYAVRITPTVVGITGAGLAINRDTEVTDKSGKSIPGLYAAGEVSGGIIGRAYIGGGGSLVNAFGLGRFAGLEAAAFASAILAKA